MTATGRPDGRVLTGADLVSSAKPLNIADRSNAGRCIVSSMEDDEPDVELRYEPHRDAVAEPSGERLVVMRSDASEISTLNPVAAIVWGVLPATRTTILGKLVGVFSDVDPETLAGDLDRFLSDMVQRDLVVCVDADG